jgi:ribose 1,5-bisphosphokinase PhnN
MLSNILRENNFNVRQLSQALTVRHKAHGHAFGLRVKS